MSLTVLIAFGANLLVAIAKSFAAVITGSASMVAESAHSWADTGNEVFLLVAERRSKRGPDQTHPLGYGKEAYIWSMFAAFGLFTAGAVVSIQHGIQELTDPEHSGEFGVAYAVLGFAFLLEGFSFVQAFRATKSAARKRKRSIMRQVLVSSDPTTRAVFFEDAAALVGLAIAFLGVLLHQLTGLAVFDAAGSILVGVLLGVVAVILIQRNRAFLLGVAVEGPVRDGVIRELLSHAEISRVTYLHIEYVGPERVLLVAAVDLAGNEEEDDVARTLRRIALAIEQDEHVLEAVLTLSVAEDPAIVPLSPQQAGA